jgi:hypothetical protein
MSALFLISSIILQESPITDGQSDLVKSMMILIQKSIKRLKYTKERRRRNTAKIVKSPIRKANKTKRGKRSKPRVVNRNSIDEIIEDVMMDLQN